MRKFAVTLLVGIVVVIAANHVAAGDSQRTEASTGAAVMQTPENPQIDYDGFVSLAEDTSDDREKRRVPIDTFLKMAAEPGTLILDCRSRAAFDAAHLKGATHLNFSDFTEGKLASVIPSKSTRILIYCNNNFESADSRSADVERMQLQSKSYVVALNIPTFINLVGYGYENVYELADVLPVDDSRLTFVGSAVASDSVPALLPSEL